MLAGLHPFIRRREPDYEGLSFVAEVTSTAMSPERFAPDRSPDFDPIVQSRFTGGRGRPVYPASQDVIFYLNPALTRGGEGSSFQSDHMISAKAVIPSSLLAQNRVRAINYPRTAGKFPWSERSNTYRPPYQSYSEAVDQAGDDPDNPDSPNSSSDYVSMPY